MVEPNRVPGPETSIRMFRHPFLEALTHMHPATPWFVGVPIMVLMTWWAFGVEDLDVVPAAALVVAGLLLWTLLEYLMHRFVFHWRPGGTWGRRLHFFIHGVHHDYPNDASRLVMPPALSVPLGVGLVAVLYALFGAPVAPGVMLGIVPGYIAYDTIHYFTHHRPMKGPIGRRLKRYHMRHHFADVDGGYGVSSPLWDIVFRTTPRPRRAKGSEGDA